MDIITYETIRSVHRNEKDDVLQQLPEGFYMSVKNWLIHKRTNHDTYSLLEAENAKKLLEDIINRREKKIVLSALRTMRGELPPKSLTESEQRFFDSIVFTLKQFREKIKEESMSYDEIVQQKIDDTKKLVDDMNSEIKMDNKKMVKMLEDMPAFVGTDSNSYGPFKKGDVVSLPDDVMTLLLARGTAEDILD
ncbi:MAG: hypothetical protein KJ697_02875 [Nanoarchaeota archaeon]|nr:hypothetical protein [Nanoarchaeota archaeon]MBU4072437.1 hypothetical protein [Candidatus Thermoplasmatota archaeon]